MLSRTAEYALRAVLRVAREEEGSPVPVDRLAEELSLPRNYLSKILHRLATEGVLDSTRGPGGGFALAVPADRLSLLEVVEPFDAIEGRRQCLLGRAECGEENACAAHHRWKEVAETVAAFFRDTTVAGLVESPAGPGRIGSG